MYIIDNDGFANSDKRYPTRLRDAEQRWLHDEVSAWVDSEGMEHVSRLEECWNTKFDDASTNGTDWIAEDGRSVRLRKAGNVPASCVARDEFYTLLPERWLRPYDPPYITPREFERELAALISDIGELA